MRGYTLAEQGDRRTRALAGIDMRGTLTRCHGAVARRSLPGHCAARCRVLGTECHTPRLRVEVLYVQHAPRMQPQVLHGGSHVLKVVLGEVGGHYEVGDLYAAVGEVHVEVVVDHLSGWVVSGW